MRTSCVLFDWGDTLMIDFEGQSGAMALWPTVEAVPHAVETLIRLRGTGLRIAVATNAADSDEAAVRVALARVGLDELVDRVYSSLELGHTKPSAEFFAAITHDLGVPEAAIVMVGDAFEVDVMGANRAGIRAVWLTDEDGHEPDSGMWRSVRSLDELPELLRAWDEGVAEEGER